MKKTLLIISIITIFFAGCKKDVEPVASKLEIVEENIEKGWDYIKINVEYDYPVELESVTLYLSEKEDMSGAEAYECNLEGKKFSAEIEGLKEGVRYYYQFEFNNGYWNDNNNSNVFLDIATKEISDIGVSTAICGGNIINNNEYEIASYGVCWDTLINPTIENNIQVSNGNMNFTSRIIKLKERLY